MWVVITFLNDASRPLQYLNRGAFARPPINAVSGVPSRPGTLGRNALRGPGLWNIDLALSKTLAIQRADPLTNSNRYDQCLQSHEFHGNPDQYQCYQLRSIHFDPRGPLGAVQRETHVLRKVATNEILCGAREEIADQWEGERPRGPVCHQDPHR